MDLLNAKIEWVEPEAEESFDIVTLLFKTHSSGDLFPVGSTNVSYFFVDSSFNFAVCNFTVNVDVDDMFTGMSSEQE